MEMISVAQSDSFCLPYL